VSIRIQRPLKQYNRQKTQSIVETQCIEKWNAYKARNFGHRKFSLHLENIVSWLEVATYAPTRASEKSLVKKGKSTLVIKAAQHSSKHPFIYAQIMKATSWEPRHVFPVRQHANVKTRAIIAYASVSRIRALKKFKKHLCTIRRISHWPKKESAQKSDKRKKTLTTIAKKQ